MILLIIIAFSVQSNKILLEDFTLQRSYHQSFFNLYEQLNRRESNIIITSDLFFHSSISLYDSTITLIEIETLIPSLKELLHPLYKESKGTNKEYFEVALALLKEIKPTSKKVVKEIELIKKTAGFAQSPVLGVRVDYSQFKPRGHYTKKRVLSDYFRAMMWLSFPKIPIENGKYYNLALNQANLLKRLNLIPVYSRINSIITELVGTTDDITPLLVLKYKDTPSPIDSLSRFRGRIVSKSEEDQVKYSFLPQRFILDSYILQLLTYDHVLGYTGSLDKLPFTAAYTEIGVQRVFPRGLDIFSILGSKTASEILKREGDTDYSNYHQIHNQLNKGIKLSKEDSIYEIFLLALKELIQEKEFVSPAYQYKNLLTASGGWTELRHATILYAKQSYTALVSMPPKIEKKVIIEPYPEVYRYLLLFVEKMDDIYSQKATRELASILQTAISISEKELEGELPDIKTVKSIPNRLKGILGEKIAPLIADVHTDPNTGMVLEEAIGNPFIINVSMRINGNPMNFVGASYSYYEFKHPMKERLTDEEWRNSIMKDKKPVSWITTHLK
ncbi:DUF3160 domain-containing protein [candidate division WOR-3 bacterium]|nr:DUF3160 domain-containing protein [candidate division WOR-3 bacterium]